MPGLVPTGVAQGLISPSIGALDLVLDEDGPFLAGDHTITTFLTTSAHGVLPAGTWGIGGTYGVAVIVNGAIPLTWGYEIGYDSGDAIGSEGWRYFNRFAQLVVMHQMIGGAFVTVQMADCNAIQSYLPTDFVPFGGDRIGLHVTVDIAVDLYFACLLA